MTVQKRYVICKAMHSIDPDIRECESETDRDSAAQVFLIEPSTEVLYFLDINEDNTKRIWTPSKAYCDDLITKFNQETAELESDEQVAKVYDQILDKLIDDDFPEPTHDNYRW